MVVYRRRRGCHLCVGGIGRRATFGDRGDGLRLPSIFRNEAILVVITSRSVIQINCLHGQQYQGTALGRAKDHHHHCHVFRS